MKTCIPCIVLFLFVLSTGCSVRESDEKLNNEIEFGLDQNTNDSPPLFEQENIQLEQQIETIREKHLAVIKRSNNLNAEIGKSLKLSRNSSLAQDLDVLLAKYHLQVGLLKAEMDSLRTELLKFDHRNLRVRSMLNQAQSDIDYLVSQLSTYESVICAKELMIDSLDLLLNRVYFVWGSLDELQSNGVIEAKKNWRGKLVPIGLGSEINHEYLTIADKRELREIPIYNERAEVLTNHPSDSYRFVKEGRKSILEILEPERFWNASKIVAITIE